MRYAIGLAAGALTLAISVPASAQNFTMNLDLFGQKKTAPAQPKVDWNRRPSTDQNTAASPSIVCGMTVVPGDAKVDPKMSVTVPDSRTKYTLRFVEPTVCAAPPQR